MYGFIIFHVFGSCEGGGAGQALLFDLDKIGFKIIIVTSYGILVLNIRNPIHFTYPKIVKYSRQ